MEFLTNKYIICLRVTSLKLTQEENNCRETSVNMDNCNSELTRILLVDTRSSRQPNSFVPVLDVLRTYNQNQRVRNINLLVLYDREYFISVYNSLRVMMTEWHSSLTTWVHGKLNGHPTRLQRVELMESN